MTKSTVAPRLWDTVENQSSYSALDDDDVVPSGSGYPWGHNGYAWGESQGGGPMLINKKSGDQRSVNSSVSYYRNSTNLSVLRDVTATYTGKFYVSWWSKFSANPSSDRTSLKLLRVGDSSTSYNGTFSWARAQTYTYNSTDGYCNITYSPAHNFTWPGIAGAWNHNEIFFDADAHRYTLTVNGVVASTSEWNSACDLEYDSIQQVGWEGNISSSLSSNIWIDDIYVDNSPSRVMLCSGSSWANRGQCELQPPSSWSDTSITITANAGRFVTNDPAYVYVVDSTGTANALGYEVEIGGTGGEDTTPPVRSLLAPSGTLSAGTTSTTISLVTDEAATCRYATTAGTAYADMTLSFDSSYALSHSTTVSGLTNGSSYTYYVRCINGAGNANTTDAPISFSVASSAGTAGSLSWQYSTYSAVRADGRIPINIVRTGGSTGSVTVQWSSNGQTALHDVDYYGNDGVTVTFADGVTTMPINTYGSGPDGIEMIANGADDDRYFQMILSNPTGGATLGTTLATVTIEGDYVAPVAALPRLRTSTGAPQRASGGGYFRGQ